MRNIAVSLTYDGSNFHGWQIQDSLRTVQGTLRDTSCKAFKEDVSIIGCGRTDTGVHARRYIASFKTACTIPVEKIPFAMNSLLPRDVSVIAAEEAAEDFHPIRSCIKKEYTYEVYNTPHRDPFRTNYALHYSGELPLDKLRTAASLFVGEHDFASMRSLGTEVKSTRREVYYFDVIPTEDGMRFVICANGFLYNMARTMVGTLLSVARGKIAPEEISDILLSGDRSRAGATAPPQGLYMTDVIYNDISL